MVNDDTKIVRVSVRNLVEFILRSGDIDNRVSGGMDREAMLMGGRLHRKIQRRMGADYHAEVSLKTLIPCGDFSLQVEGRADGIIIREEKGQTKATVDEIKGVLRDLEHIKEPVGVHVAQAKCYAYIYAEQRELEQIDVQMTYCNLDTEEIKRFVSSYTKEELKTWFCDLTAQYEKWARFRIEWEAERDRSIKNVEFPFAYRPGQRDVAAAVYRTILREKKLFIQAPTGVGKTISTVFPAVKAVGEGLGSKIFYLTAKTITRTVAGQAFSVLRANGLRMKVITLTAKEKICPLEETVCNPDACPYAKGHFDRVNDAVYDILTNVSSGENMDVMDFVEDGTAKAPESDQIDQEVKAPESDQIDREVKALESDRIDRAAIERQAEKFCVCPFELSLDISTWADAVICDYNYAFDPNAHLKRFFSEGSGADYIFLIDEAHNLVERGREMYSAALYKEDFLELKRKVRHVDAKLARQLESVNRMFLALKRVCENYQVLNSVSHIALKLMNLLTVMEDFLDEPAEEELREFVLDLYFQVRSFVSIHDIIDENYVIYSELEESGRFKVKLYCVNPAENLRNYLAYGRGTVFFSATLLPIHYYKSLLSVEKDDYAIYARSPFPAENRLLLQGRDISTRYTMRSAQMYRRFAEYIAAAVSGKKGNYMAFFPSYRFMEDVYEVFDEERAGVQVICQSQYMGEKEREDFLARFEAEHEGSLVGFCVMGGVFSEGIDLTEDRLIGAVIVGTGIPQVCNDREIVRNYFDERGMRGFDYAYLYPGMNKVLQSAGRVIRTETDRGMILLLDDRFFQRQYRETFPREWENFHVCDPSTIKDYTESFWK